MDSLDVMPANMTMLEIGIRFMFSPKLYCAAGSEKF